MLRANLKARQQATPARACGAHPIYLVAWKNALCAFFHATRYIPGARRRAKALLAKPSCNYERNWSELSIGWIYFCIASVKYTSGTRKMML